MLEKAYDEALTWTLLVHNSIHGICEGISERADIGDGSIQPHECAP